MYLLASLDKLHEKYTTRDAYYFNSNKVDILEPVLSYVLV